MGWIKIPRGRDAAALARNLSALRYRVHRRKTMAAATLLTGGYNRMPDYCCRDFRSEKLQFREDPVTAKVRRSAAELSGLRVCRCYRARPSRQKNANSFFCSFRSCTTKASSRRNNTSRAHYRVDAAYIRAMGSGGQTRGGTKKRSDQTEDVPAH